ncbi:MAG: mechanosensitive ion channel family protein [Lachnospiraceae bacterium]
MIRAISAMITTNTEITVEEIAETLKKTNLEQVQDYLLSYVPDIINFFLQIFLAVVVFFIGTRLIKLARKIFTRWLKHMGFEEGTAQFLDSFVKFVLYFFLIILMLTLFGLTTASVVAVLGSMGLTLGLALQGSLSNFAGGVLILIVKPFRIGDYIKEDTHNNEGFVTEISIFYTKLFTPDKKTIIIPNGTLANSSMTNATDINIRRIDLYVGISYDSDLQKAREVLFKLICDEPRVLQDQANRTFVSELADSAVIIGMHAWVNNEDYWDTKWDLTERIKLTLDSNLIEIPYNKLDVKIK